VLSGTAHFEGRVQQGWQATICALADGCGYALSGTVSRIMAVEPSVPARPAKPVYLKAPLARRRRINGHAEVRERRRSSRRATPDVLGRIPKLGQDQTLSAGLALEHEFDYVQNPHLFAGMKKERAGADRRCVDGGWLGESDTITYRSTFAAGDIS